MQTFKKIGEWFLISGFVFLLIILLFQSQLQLPTWLKVAGRMHPMFLHFPIVLLLLSFLSLWIPSHEQSVWNWFDGLRLVAAISAVVTAIMGLLLSLEEGEQTQLLQWHKWGGVAVAFLALFFYTASNFFIRNKLVGKGFTIMSGLMIFLTGHWGAGLTHGDNYLLQPMSGERKVAVEDAVVYNDVIRPILERKCLSCHREGNMKGGLLMETVAGMLRGGKTGPLFVPGDPEMSLLIQRIHLPVNEKKHMPPASKPPLTEEEAAILYAWIKSGALLKEKLVTLPATDSFRMLAALTLSTGASSPQQQVYDFPAADRKTIASLNNNYRVIEPIALGAAALSVKFYGRAQFNSKALKELLPLKQQVTELSLSKMPVKDEDLKTISQFSNLIRLNLNYTDIIGTGLQYLRTLTKLKQLSISGTEVHAAALKPLDSLPALSKIFIWDTPIDSMEVELLTKENKHWKLETGFYDNREQKIALPPPSFRLPSGVLDKIKTVELKHPIAGVEIRYTTDGTKPDSLTSPVYEKPLMIDSTVTLKARAFREGWFGSNTVQAAYIMRKIKPDSITLLTTPDAKYAMRSRDQLSDGDLGDLNFANGQWVGFQKTEAEFICHLDPADKVTTVLLNLLKNTGAHIFPPVSIEVWGGMEKSQMKLLAQKKIAIPLKNEPATTLQEQVRFEATALKYLQVKVERLKALPSWHDSKGKPAWVMISEIALN